MIIKNENYLFVTVHECIYYTINNAFVILKNKIMSYKWWPMYKSININTFDIYTQSIYKNSDFV